MNFLRRFGLTRERAFLVIRYGLVGLCGAAIQVGAFYAWVSILGLESHYLLGSAASLALALITTFTLQKYWTFRDSEASRAPMQFASYATIALGNLVLNLLLMRGAKEAFEAYGVDFFGGWHVVAQAAIVLFVAGLSFLANYFVTFRKAKPVPRGEAA